jgi:hypothetical protein
MTERTRKYIQPEESREEYPGENDVPLDLVYTYVDGDDPLHHLKRRHWDSDQTGGGLEDRVRFCNLGEIRYSVRSALKHMPWIRRIYIVTDSQTPRVDECLIGSGRVVIVDHRDIIPQEYLPNFNSIAIESFLHRIEGLSDIYLYDNDDYMHFSSVPKDFFIRTAAGGKISLELHGRLAAVRRAMHALSCLLPGRAAGFVANPHTTAISNAYSMLRSRSRSLKPGEIIGPRHFTQIHRKSTAWRLDEEFSVELHENRSHRFRCSGRFSYAVLAYSMELAWHPEDAARIQWVRRDRDVFEMFDFTALFADRSRIWKKIGSSHAMFACLNNIPLSERAAFLDAMEEKGLNGFP